MCYLQVRVDNTDATHACFLIVSHKYKIRIKDRQSHSLGEYVNKREKFYLAEAGEKKELLL